MKHLNAYITYDKNIKQYLRYMDNVLLEEADDTIMITLSYSTSELIIILCQIMPKKGSNGLCCVSYPSTVK